MSIRLDPDQIRRLKTPLIAAAVAAGLLVLLGWSAWDRSYRFDASSVVELSEVRCLASLVEDLRRITGQEPVTTGPEAARAVAAWIRQPGADDAAGWADLLAPGEDPGLRHASLNGTLMILSLHADEVKPGSVRGAKTDDEAAAMVLGVLRRHVAARRERDAFARLADTGLEPIWSRNGWPGWPAPCLLRRALRRLVGRPDDRAQYVGALVKDLESLVRLSAWYDALAAFDEQLLGDPAVPGFWLVHDRTEPLVPEGWSARLDVRMEYRRPASGESRDSLIAAMGLRMHGVRAEPASETRRTDKPVPRLDPASGQLSVDVGRFVAFLHAAGLPETFDVLEVLPRRTGGGPALAFAWDLTIRHREFESFVVRDTLDPGIGRPVALEEAVRRLADRIHGQFIKHLVGTRSDRGWEVAFRDAGAAAPAGSLFATLRSPRVGTLPFLVRLGDDGRLSWSDLSSLADRRRLTGLLAGQVAELAGLEARIRFAGLTYDRTDRGRLQGTFSLAGEPGHESCGFSLGPEGRADVVLSARRRLELAEARRTAVRLADSNAGPDTAATVSLQAVRDVLDTHFVTISPLLEVEPGADGRSLTLGLRLADYPTLVLGPAPVPRRQDLQRVVTDLLAQESVADHAAAQWDRSIDNPRWGDVRAAIRAWDPDRGRATVECRLTLCVRPEVVIPWSDELTVESGYWRSAASDQIAALVAPHIDTLKQSVHRLAASQGFDLDVDVDPDAFGPGVWLRLHPPAAAFRCRMEPYPGFGWKVGLEKVLLDRDGLHLNPAFSFQIRASVPIPPGSPVATLSDPLLRIDFADRDVTVEAKVTPPWLPVRGIPVLNTVATSGVAALDETFPTLKGLRMDNPWLDLAFAKARLGGSLARRELRGGADLVFLRSREMASGRLVAHFPAGGSPALHGRMAAIATAPSNLPRLDGELWIDRQHGFETMAQVGIAGVRLHGRLALRTADVDETRQPRGEFEGEGRFPGVGRVNVIGVTDLDFRSPVFVAKGTVPSGELAGALRYEIQVLRSGYTCHYKWIRPGQKPRTLVEEGPTLDREAAENIEKRLRQAKSSGPADAKWGPLAPAQQAAVDLAPEVRFASISLSGPPDGGGGGIETPSKSEADEPEVEARPMIPFAGEIDSPVENGHLIVRSRSGGRVYLDLPVERLGLNVQARCQCAIWLPEDGTARCEILILDFRGRRVLRARLAGASDLDDVADLGDDLKDLMAAMADPARQGLFQRVAIELVDARMLDPTAQAARVSDTSWLVRYRSPNLGPVATFSWIDPLKRPATARVYERRIPAERQSELWPRLSELVLPVDRPSVVCAESTESGRIALLAGAPGGKFRLWPDAGRDSVLTVERVPGERRRSFLQALADCVEACWRPGGPDLTGARAWYGPEGVCVLSAQQPAGWWLFPAAVEAARVEFKSQLPVFLSRDRFAAAHIDEGRELWPDRFASPSVRDQITGGELAETVVQSWSEAQKEGWAAHPMGLLTRLALERGGGPVNAASRPPANSTSGLTQKREGSSHE